ncbi:hypothetical protein [Erythrobacter sp. QSSC1-22B]|uniref:hypothetical protein n=1 Tax=Erythrobacter sp. QSSC1-22B TaxID=1860125 RepID=UPI0011A6200D|nr:hypothetical protein [Erythrobacter sp. QSSC1-22B]
MKMRSVGRTRTTTQRKSDISKRLKRFIATDTPAMRELRKQILNPLEEVGEVAIIGGLVRDIIRYGVDKRPISDMDLVIQGSPSAVAAVAKKLSAKENRFGGFGLKTDHYKVDFWALSTTWARTHANVPVSSIKDLPNSTFFNWDAVVYSTKDSKTYFKENYLEDIARGFLEVNVAETASHQGNLIRALRRLFAWEAYPGPKLIQFLKSAAPQYEWDDLVRQEKAAFYTTYLDHFSGYNEYFRRLEDSSSRFLPVQLSLFADERY